MRCADLLAQRDEPVDRAGGGAVVEVYPAASLKQWGLPARSYKGRGNAPALGLLVDALLKAASCLDLGECAGACRKSDDAFDALVAALTARAAADPLLTIPPDD